MRGTTDEPDRKLSLPVDCERWSANNDYDVDIDGHGNIPRRGGNPQRIINNLTSGRKSVNERGLEALDTYRTEKNTLSQVRPRSSRPTRSTARAR